MGYAHGTDMRASVPENPLCKACDEHCGEENTHRREHRQDRRDFCLFHSLILEEGKLRPVSWSDDPGLHS